MRLIITPIFVLLIASSRENEGGPRWHLSASETYLFCAREEAVDESLSSGCIAPGFLDTDDSNHAALESYAAALA